MTEAVIFKVIYSLDQPAFFIFMDIPVSDYPLDKAFNTSC